VRIVVLAMLLTASAPAQTAPANFLAACGSVADRFNVKLDESQHTLRQPDPGKARVYFIHDAGTNFGTAYPTVKVAVDGTWVGTNRVNSYFSVSVEPGDHHMCVTLQSHLAWASQRVELAHFTATADTVYYYRTRLFLSSGIQLLELEPIDDDQAKYLIASFPLAISSPKK
jgi:hypothetical protein